MGGMQLRMPGLSCDPRFEMGQGIDRSKWWELIRLSSTAIFIFMCVQESEIVSCENIDHDPGVVRSVAIVLRRLHCCIASTHSYMLE